MGWTPLTGYAIVAMVATIVVFALSARLEDERRPAGERIGLSLAAGAVWPVVLLGLAQLSSFAIYAKAREHDDDEARIDVLV